MPEHNTIVQGTFPEMRHASCMNPPLLRHTHAHVEVRMGPVLHVARSVSKVCLSASSRRSIFCTRGRHEDATGPVRERVEGDRLFAFWARGEKTLHGHCNPLAKL